MFQLLVITRNISILSYKNHQDSNSHNNQKLTINVVLVLNYF